MKLPRILFSNPFLNIILTTLNDQETWMFHIFLCVINEHFCNDLGLFKKK